MPAHDRRYDGGDDPRFREDADHDAYHGGERRGRGSPNLQETSTLGILSVVSGGIGLSIAVLPCFGMFGTIGGALGLLLGLMSLVEARNSGGRVGTGVPVAGTLVSVLALLVGGVWLLLFAGLVRNVPNVPPAIAPQAEEVGSTDAPAFARTATELDSQYDRDREGADAQYTGKWVDVTGRVKWVTLDTHPGRVSVELVGMPTSSVHCLFHIAQKDNVLTTERGQEVVIRGRCAGVLRLGLTLEECVLISRAEKGNEVGMVPAVGVNAATLTRDYSEDADGADREYKGKVVEVTGAVAKVVRNKSGAATVQFEADAGGPRVVGRFTIKDARALADVEDGERVTLRGRCLGRVGGEIVIDACALVR